MAEWWLLVGLVVGLSALFYFVYWIGEQHRRQIRELVAAIKARGPIQVVELEGKRYAVRDFTTSSSDEYFRCVCHEGSEMRRLVHRVPIDCVKS